MTKIKYRFKGHESFILREGWLNKGMREVRNDPFVFSQNYGADVLGVGPNMAKAIRYWMRTCGLLKERGKQGVFLSKLGEQIWEYDKYLEDPFSLWIIHCNIVKNRGQATAWSLFFNEYDEIEFTKDELVKELINKAGNLEGLKKFSEKSVEADGEALLRMYVRKPERESDPEEKNISPFGIFELVKQKGSLYWKSQPPLHLLPAEIVGYLLKDCTSKEGAVSSVKYKDANKTTESRRKDNSSPYNSPLNFLLISEKANGLIQNHTLKEYFELCDKTALNSVDIEDHTFTDMSDREIGYRIGDEALQLFLEKRYDDFKSRITAKCRNLLNCSDICCGEGQGGN